MVKKNFRWPKYVFYSGSYLESIYGEIRFCLTATDIV